MEREGFKLKPYKDTANKLTIGVGHLLTETELSTKTIKINQQPIKWQNGLTKEQVIALLSQDLIRFEKAINDAIKVPLTQNQFDSLISFIFNLGENRLISSKIAENLNKHNYSFVPAAMIKYINEHKNGQLVPNKGLINRRKADIALWLKA